jgi:hypothetical protein
MDSVLATPPYNKIENERIDPTLQIAVYATSDGGHFYAPGHKHMSERMLSFLSAGY